MNTKERQCYRKESRIISQRTQGWGPGDCKGILTSLPMTDMNCVTVATSKAAAVPLTFQLTLAIFPCKPSPGDGFQLHRS